MESSGRSSLLVCVAALALSCSASRAGADLVLAGPGVAPGEECDDPACEACPELELAGPTSLRRGLDLQTTYLDLVLSDCVRCWSATGPAGGHPATCCGDQETGYLAFLLSDRPTPLATEPLALAGDGSHSLLVAATPGLIRGIRSRRWTPLGPDHPLRFGRDGTRDTIGPVTSRRQIMRIQLQF